jgi:hypothetical protein
MTEYNPLSAGHTPKHQLEKGVLGKPKHGMQRVSDLAAKHDDGAAIDSDATHHSEDTESDNSKDKEHIA